MDRIVNLNCVAQVLVYKHLGALQWSLFVPPIPAGSAPRPAVHRPPVPGTQCAHGARMDCAWKIWAESPPFLPSPGFCKRQLWEDRARKKTGKNHGKHTKDRTEPIQMNTKPIFNPYMPMQFL
jgi:hypothetical protein